ncbi:MAG TPA: SGNH/GDSL hydrolase family protein [Phycisphaerae bacterium]|nr:SGNH/GDSL hydrolase family protein [Phycisphaerae bacterium]HRW53924.1 SGNH/GDSL hydrolase family protein [Phycisphaerae bacterium]
MSHETLTSNRRPRSRRRRAALAICVLAGASIVGIAMAEVALRLVWSPAADRVTHSFDFEKALRRDDELGYVPRASVIVEYPPYNAVFSTNSAGLRGPEQRVDRAAGRRRIVVLGDSFAWGHGVSTGLAFPEVIDAALPLADVINLGVPGYDLSKSLRFYERVGRAYQPDLVIVAVCQNDFQVRDTADRPSATTSSYPAAATNAASTAPASRGVKQWLRTHSRLYQLAQQTINTNRSLARFSVRIGLKEELAGFEMLDDNLRPALIDAPPGVQRSRESVCRQLLAIRDTVAADGATTLVALIPCIQSIDPNELAKSIAYTRYEASDFDLSAPMRLLTDFCATNDIPVVDPTPDFSAAYARGESLYLNGDLHFNKAGHALFARAILSAIDRRSPIEARTAAVSDRSTATRR